MAACASYANAEMQPPKCTDVHVPSFPTAFKTDVQRTGRHADLLVMELLVCSCVLDRAGCKWGRLVRVGISEGGVLAQPGGGGGLQVVGGRETITCTTDSLPGGCWVMWIIH